MRIDFQALKPTVFCIVLLLLIVGAGACSPNPPAPIAETVTSAPSATLERIPTSTQSLQESTTSPTLAPISPTATPGMLAPDTPIVGIEMASIDARGGLDLVASSGAYWVRRNALMWSYVEPFEGRRDWNNVASLERELQNASQQGLQVILVVRSTPGWAQKLPGISCGAVREDKMAAFGTFMHDVVARYSVPPYNVKYWELGNEPDVEPQLVGPDSIFGCWGDAEDPYYGGGYYADMLKAVYPQIKTADPDAQVLTGGILLGCDPDNPPESPAGSGQYKDCTPSRFFEGILKNGGGDYFDGVSFHAYDYYYGAVGAYGNANWASSSDTTGPGLIAKAEFLRNLLSAYGYPDKKLFNTEIALLCSGDQAQCSSDTFNNAKAYYAAQSYASARAENLYANIWYSLLGWRSSGLVDIGMNPLPVYDALKISAQQLNQAAFRTNVAQYDGVKGYEFTRDGASLWVLWSLDGQDHSISLPSTPDSITGVYGESLPASDQITVSLEPIYLEWETK